ncbi:MAG TPA: DMT family transporter [Verrucomicrobiae bacterium]|nr:DMT family transporter [Verrucomicrobiae bacterium]
MWLSVSIINMLAVTATRLVQKRFVNGSDMNAFRLNWIMFGAGLPITLPIIALHWHTITQLHWTFWLDLVAVVGGYYPAVSYLYIRVIRENELSDVLPLQSLVPVFTAFFGWILLGQDPSWLAFGGLLAVTAAIYVLYSRPRIAWYKPVVTLGSSGAARAMLTVSLITAAAAIGDKFGIEHSSVSIYLALNVTGAVILLVLCDLIAIRRRAARPLKTEAAKLSGRQWTLLACLGVLQIMSIVLSFIAVHISVNTSYTLAIRNLNIVAASLAAVLLLHEHLTRYKLISYGFSALGVVMLAL